MSHIVEIDNQVIAEDVTLEKAFEIANNWCIEHNVPVITAIDVCEGLNRFRAHHTICVLKENNIIYITEEI